MGLHLHHNCQAIADIHHPGVLLPHAHQHSRALDGEEFQQELGVLIAAVLTPQRAEHPQLDQVRLSPQPLHNELVFLLREGDIL